MDCLVSPYYVAGEDTNLGIVVLKQNTRHRWQAMEARFFLPLTKFPSVSIPNYQCLAP